MERIRRRCWSHAAWSALTLGLTTGLVACSDDDSPPVLPVDAGASSSLDESSSVPQPATEMSTRTSSAITELSSSSLATVSSGASATSEIDSGTSPEETQGSMSETTGSSADGGTSSATTSTEITTGQEPSTDHSESTDRTMETGISSETLVTFPEDASVPWADGGLEAGPDWTVDDVSSDTPPLGPVAIANPGFEEGTNGSVPLYWTAVGPAGSAKYGWSDTSGRDGPGYLDVWFGSDYTVDVSQLLTSVPNGTYTLNIWHRGGSYTEQYIYVSGHVQGSPETLVSVPTTPTDSFERLTLENIVVTSGQLTLGIHSVGLGGAWSHFDDVSLTPAE